MNSNDAMAMNKPLTKQEKKIKLSEARRRAILWSEREIRNKQLRAQAQIKTISLSDSSEIITTALSRHSDQANEDSTIVSLRQTIQDLTIQRQELDVTLKVLNNHLNHLLSQYQAKGSGHKRTKHNG